MNWNLIEALICGAVIFVVLCAIASLVVKAVERIDGEVEL